MFVSKPNFCFIQLPYLVISKWFSRIDSRVQGWPLNIVKWPIEKYSTILGDKNPQSMKFLLRDLIESEVKPHQRKE